MKKDWSCKRKGSMQISGNICYNNVGPNDHE